MLCKHLLKDNFNISAFKIDLCGISAMQVPSATCCYRNNNTWKNIFVYIHKKHCGANINNMEQEFTDCLPFGKDLPHTQQKCHEFAQLTDSITKFVFVKTNLR